jgi:hypothetical protein
LVPFCSFECITFAAGSILALFGNHFDTVFAQKKTPAVLVPWVSVVRRNARSALNPSHPCATC